MPKQFPTRIHVTVEEPRSDDPYLRVVEEGLDSEDFTSDTVVAVYQLVEVGTVRVHRQFESKKAKRSR